MKQHPPKVSVIIPVYNVEPYLRECLDSVVDQTLRDIEIICVDDGSTDGSPAILEEYRQRDSRVAVLTQENRGQSAARNRGMETARGEYVYFVDSDDYVDLTLLEKTTALADKMDLDALVFGLDAFVESGAVTDHLEFSLKAEENSPQVLSGVAYMKWSKDHESYPTVAVAELWRSDFLNDNSLRFQEGIIYEDELFSFQCFMAAKRVYQITDSFYYYRRRKESTTLKTVSHKNVESYFACAQGILKYAFRDSNTPEEKEEIWRAYVEMVKETGQDYHALSPEEREKVAFPSKMENELFRQIIASNDPGDEHSLLHFATSGFRCLREHGLLYTLRCALKRFTGKSDLPFSRALPKSLRPRDLG